MQISSELTQIQNRIDQNTTSLNSVVNNQIAMQHQQHHQQLPSHSASTTNVTSNAKIMHSQTVESSPNSTGQPQHQQQHQSTTGGGGGGATGVYQHAMSQTNMGQFISGGAGGGKNEFEFLAQAANSSNNNSNKPVQMHHQTSQPSSLATPILVGSSAHQQLQQQIMFAGKRI